MATKAETNFRKKVRSDLNFLIKSGRRLWYEAIQQRGIKGSPDFILCASGFFITLELKSAGGVISRIQNAKMKGILEAGGLALVAEPSNWINVLETIGFYLQGEEDDCGRTHKNS